MGYDRERFVGEVNEGLLCSICWEVLEDPVLSPCEHAFCRKCLRSWLVDHPYCPEDWSALDITKLRPLFRYIKNDLARLQISCKNQLQGCEFICALESIHLHEEQCDFGLLNGTFMNCEYLCYRCGTPVSRWTLEAHHRICQDRSRICAEKYRSLSELFAELLMLREVIDDKVEQIKSEIEFILDFQRQLQVQRDGFMRRWSLWRSLVSASPVRDP